MKSLKMNKGVFSGVGPTQGGAVPLLLGARCVGRLLMVDLASTTSNLPILPCSASGSPELCSLQRT